MPGNIIITPEQWYKALSSCDVFSLGYGVYYYQGYEAVMGDNRVLLFYRCEYCGSRLLTGGKFCAFCGAPALPEFADKDHDAPA